MFKPVPNETIWPVIEAERTRVLRYVTSLNDSQWDEPSLCDGWLVKDVVAHLAIEYKYTISNSVLPFVLSGFNINEFIMITAIKAGKKPRTDVLKMFEAMVTDRVVSKTLSPFNALTDLLVHEQDIRIALKDQRPMPVEPLRLVFTYWNPSDYNFGERITGVADRVKGLRFVVEDLAISVGTGDEVRGSAEDILLAVTGRGVSIHRLSGKGSVILKQRLS